MNLHQTLGRNLSHGRVVRFKQRQRGDIPDRSIGIGRPGGQLLGAVAGDHHPAGFDLERRQLSRGGDIGQSPLLNPAGQRGELGRVGLEPYSAAMRHEARPLPQEQARLGSVGRQPPPPVRLGQVLVIVQRLKAEQRELKAILSPARLGVTDPNVAARLGEDGHHIVGEADRFVGGDGGNCGDSVGRLDTGRAACAETNRRHTDRNRQSPHDLRRPARGVKLPWATHGCFSSDHGPPPPLSTVESGGPGVRSSIRKP